MSEIKTKTEIFLYNKALRLITNRPQSKKEIFLKLILSTRRRKISDAKNSIDKTIRELENKNILNDFDFAKWWISQRSEFSPRGKTLLIQELKSKGVSEDVINKAIDFFWKDEVDRLGVKRKALSEIELAKKAANKKIREYSKFSALDFERKMIRYLLRRGFDYEVSREVSYKLKAK